MKVLITSPSLDIKNNISGISSVVRFILESNHNLHYVHFEIGRRDNEKGRLQLVRRMVRMYVEWFVMLMSPGDVLIHFNMPLCKLSAIRDFPLILIARIFRKKMIVHLHGGDFLTDKEPPSWLISLKRLALPGDIPVIVLSPVEKEVVAKRYRCKKVFVLPNCINLSEALHFNIQHQSGITILFLGRISVDKGLEYLYDAALSLKRRGVEFRFIMAGKGPDEEQYIRKFKELLGKSFDFRGVVSGDSKSELLKKCNVFILPSFYEGLPMALLESMSFGLVPVATDVGSIKAVITDGMNGILIRSHSSSDIESALEKLSGDEVYLHELSENARKYIFRNFRTESYIEKLNAIYESVE